MSARLMRSSIPDAALVLPSSITVAELRLIRKVLKTSTLIADTHAGWHNVKGKDIFVLVDAPTLVIDSASTNG